MAQCHSVEIHKISLHDFYESFEFFRENKAQKFFLVKMAKVAYGNCNFQIFRVNLRINMLLKKL